VNLTTTTSTPYTFSVYAKRGTNRYIGLRVTEALSTHATFDFDTGTWANAQTGTTNTSTYVGNGWYLLTSTRTETSGASKYWGVALVNSDGAENNTMAIGQNIYIWHPQGETKTFATSFVNGSRAAGALDYPILLNAVEGTLNIWVNVNAAMKNTADYRHIFSVNTSAGGDDGIVLFHDNGVTNFRLKCSNLAGAVTNVTVSDSLIANGWRMLTARWNASRLSLFCDGVEVGFAATPNLPTGFKNLISIGHEAAIRQGDTVFGELRIDNRAVSNDEIMAWYQSQSPFYNPFDYRGYAY
jgi:hypothetical protein